MQKLRFHHIGIATEDIEASLQELERHFNIIKISDKVYDKNQNAYLCMVILENGFQLEFVEGEIIKNLVRKRMYLYHTCYCVSDIEEALCELKLDNYLQVSEPKEAVLFENRKVAFLSGKLGIIELLQDEL